jgi:hypothetical protein
MQIRVNLSIDVTKIEKERLYKGAKGTYLNLTTYLDLDEKDQYDNNGFISQQVSKEEQEAKVRSAILGNCQVVWKSDGAAPQAKAPVANMSLEEMDDDLPF